MKATGRERVQKFNLLKHPFLPSLPRCLCKRPQEAKRVQKFNLLRGRGGWEGGGGRGGGADFWRGGGGKGGGGEG